MRLILLCLMLVLGGPALAVQPDEVLSDPALEARARDISRVLRCPVCQGETIDESNAPISRDLRLYLRERLVAGDSDAQAIQAVTDRFGEYVLFQPPARGWNWLLYLAGPVMALLALLIGWRFVAARGRAEPEGEGLTPEEKARLDRIMRD
ncbi:cytochrome c-type biogenesis protein CcmH [Paracoccus yeei]|uniref:Cytochrome c-type biogenesis protein n=2 Tax=Paracoccus TaxID=265 RepID=A0A1V0GVP7_9RHOB|nr:MULTISPECIES: cytochrome c-type biogenesis protein [Paracoccus]ARC37965.1 cytochrome c-type biogenesis protein CcmH [Paracoccus yeei]ATQ57160.1 cytochrome c-type biogenesis protein CcmH [Paracoccus yeei]AWX94043.1 cytochrome c-type biogenesis protein CcmH [Paracoccus mutanolyticus]AYF01325.1 cytochrome c-type biogenesis protein CcmH [Paracoccus yeei]OWJ96080.1 cytochrome c-type biogenesis protein CcmH [Paracoccus yeei]